MNERITVYYVLGTGPEDQTMELAKYFTGPDAEDHAARMRMPSAHRGLSNIHVETRVETKDEQHHAHGGKIALPS